jgi:hypothetical protein
VLLRDEQIGERERPEQPLVPDRDEEVGAKPTDVGRYDAGGLAGVDHEPRAERVGPVGHRLEIDQRAVRGVHVGHAHHANALVEHRQEGLGPRLARLALDGDDLGARFPCRDAPAVYPRRVFAGEHEDAVAGREAEVAPGDGEAVARRRHDRHTVRVGADEAREQRTEALDVAEPVRARDRPRATTTLERALAGQAHAVELGGEARRVEVRDVGRNVERLPLNAQRGVSRRRAAHGGQRRCPTVSR